MMNLGNTTVEMSKGKLMNYEASQQATSMRERSETYPSPKLRQSDHGSKSIFDSGCMDSAIYCEHDKRKIAPGFVEEFAQKSESRILYRS